MMRNNTLAGLVVAAVLSLSLTACKDTKTQQENEQLKAQVTELQKDNAQLQSDLQTISAARDALTAENESLKAQIKTTKSKHGTKGSTRKRHRGSASRES